MYKKLLGFSLLLVVLFGMQSVEAASPTYKTVQSTQLKASKQKGAKTLMTVKANTKVDLLSKTNSWAHVQIGKTKGYLSMRSVMPLETPIASYDMNEVMSYKGTDIVSISGVSYKIDSALKPFFQKNGTALKSMIVVPKTSGRTLTGWKQLSFFPLGQPASSLVIDKAAASRIDSLHIPSTNFTLTTAGPLRQVVKDTYAHYPPLDDDKQTLTLNGQIEQLHTAGEVKIAGKGTIERWDISKDTKYSYEIPVRYTGEVGFLNIRNTDVVVRGTNTLKVRTVAAPTKTHVLGGKNGVIGSIKPSKTIRGKKMGKAELAIDKMFSNVNEASVTNALDTLNISYTTARVGDYVTALRQNEAAGPNKRLVNSVTDLKDIVRLVDAVMTTKQTTQAYVHTSDRQLTVQMSHDHVDNASYHNQYARAVTAMVTDGTLQTIRFKRPLIEKKEWYVSQEKDQAFLYDFPVGSSRLVTIDGNTTRSLMMETKEVERPNYSEPRIELVSINDKPLSAYQQEPPAFEAKVIESEGRTYVAIRSSDREWLRNTHFFNVDVNANYRTGGPVSTDKINLGSWKSSETVIFEMHGAKRLNNLTIQSFGYKDAVYK
ncbi:hypothetical protein [Exiguobacterium qingdaonense]|uniref:hypothetical protein n=1 Tax=Exiguobacterium qingdaonense TaxID=2751251 RepID=UPI001BE80439|nr:hypothetical protein [Exiguobacterium qingdaonense]